MYHAPVRQRTRRPRTPLGWTYLGEDERYYYFMRDGANPQLGGFFDNLGGMFKRMVKFTPKSFTPGNIYKGFINTTLTVATAGAYQVLPKNLKKTVYEVGKVAIPVVAGGVLAATAGPAVMGALQPKLAAAGNLLGKAASSLGSNLFGFLSKLGPAQQARVVEQLTPQQIAEMETSSQLPASVQPLFEQAMQASLPSTGAAALYDPSAMAAQAMEEERKQSSFDPSMLLFLALPLGAVFLLSGKR